MGNYNSFGLRSAIWRAVLSRTVEGQHLPWWAIVVRALLYPMDFFYWRMSNSRGYQWQSNTWLINGVRYSAEGLKALSEAEGQTFKIKRVGEMLTVEKVRDGEDK